MNGTYHPPSTKPSTHIARRAIATCVTAVLAIGAPVGLVAATASGAGAPSARIPVASRAAERPEVIRAQYATQAELATITIAPPTTIAPPPPPPPPPPPRAVQPVTTGGGFNDPNNPAAWDRLAQCEAGGNWAINTGNGYYGGLQFSLSSWRGAGGTGRPDQASRETQIAIGQNLQRSAGWGSWPGCTRKLGYR